MRYLSWIVSIPLALVAISFAVTNREPVTLGLWPLDAVLTVPSFALVLVSLVVGFAVGGLVSWVSAGKHRRAVRKERARADQLQRDLDAARLHAADLEKRIAAADRVAANAPPADVPADVKVMSLR
ncbi:lipopolysaccharide assembly LapA domain-containing protein [Azospirillum sp. B4]|uniref:LapA family protein n=1 Tax=Azospirillum sp. B4 TaxID=95605 RepID=UPI0005C99788|nr:LapA family protein [Azospirillum sp. B4]